jgi:NADPH-dependent stearoyl-CoA 9-desaturase
MKNRKLNPSELEAFGAELDQIREETLAKVGEEDAQYIRDIIQLCRDHELLGRELLKGDGSNPASWLRGTWALGISKILENMEIGHNIMHGQYDFMNDPDTHSQTYEWDTASTSESWRHSHNYMHHTYTNIVGKDRDLGYGIMRLTDQEPWKPQYLMQPVSNMFLSLLFEWGVALHDLEANNLASGAKKLTIAELKPVLSKMFAQFAKDYVYFPVTAGTNALPVLTGNITANLMRNVWAHAIIFCGHFTTDAETFTQEETTDESRGAWYLRQLRGSSNLKGDWWFHILTGNLSHQIEHHLYPDVPAWRYAEMAPKVQAVCEKYGQNYNTGSFAKQYSEVLKRIFRFSLPDTWFGKSTPALA